VILTTVPTFVIANGVIMKTPMVFVNLVTTPVNLVTISDVALPVWKLEVWSTTVLVNVYQDTMKLTNHYVHHVMPLNVSNVLECQTTVLLVLKEESLHQNVSSQNQPPHPP
jgi:hypothetical protein